MKTKDYDHYNYYGMLEDNEAIRRKKPNVFIYQQISDECGIYEVRVGGGYDAKNLPAFKIPFTTTDGDFVMVKYAVPKKRMKLSPHSKPSSSAAKQEELEV
jgi:hypothetical protein